MRGLTRRTWVTGAACALVVPAPLAGCAAPATTPGAEGRAGGTLTVGPRGKFANINDAYAAARDGDTLEIDGGTTRQLTYSLSGPLSRTHSGWWKSLTVRGVGSFKPKVQGSSGGGMNSPFGIWSGTRGQSAERVALTLDNLEISGVSYGIRLFSDVDLTVRRCVFYNSLDGILGGHYFGYDSAIAAHNTTAWVVNAAILLEHCEFAYNGNGSGQTHNIYVSTRGSLTMRYCYSHRVWGGHIVKSRAAVTRLYYNRFACEDAIGVIGSGAQAGEDALYGASAVLDFPNYGDTVLVGNVIQKGWWTNNGKVIGYGEDGPVGHQHPIRKLTLAHNTLVGTVGFSGPRWVVSALGGRQQPIEFSFVNNLILSRTFNRAPSGPVDGNASLAAEVTTPPVVNAGNVIFVDGSAPVADAVVARDFRPIARTGLEAPPSPNPDWVPREEFQLVDGRPDRLARPDASLVGAHALVASPPATAAPPARYRPATPGGREVDWGHAINADLVGLYPFDEGTGAIVRDIAYGHRLDFGPGCRWVTAPGPSGHAVRVDQANGSLAGTSRYPLNILGNVTAFVVGRVDAEGTPEGRLLNLGNDEYLALLPRLRGTIRYLSCWTPVWDIVDTRVAQPALGAWTSYAFVVDSTTQRLYVDGVQVHTAPRVKTHNGGGPHWVWAIRSGLFSVSHERLLNRALSPAEIASLHANPLLGTRAAGAAAPRD